MTDDTQVLASAPRPADVSRLDPVLRIRLSLMMLVQYLVWGSWWVVLSIYLDHIGFSGVQKGAVFATMAIASIISPMIFGQIADRWVPTQYLLSVLHLAGAVMLYVTAGFTTFGPFYTGVLIYALLFIPTISLTNALSFHQIPDAARHFPGIRVFGTIGWIVAGLLVGWTFDEKTPQPIYLACALSAVMGIYCLLLPNTPPSGRAGDALPFVKALGLLKDGRFILFLVASFLLSIMLAGYFSFGPGFLQSINMERIAPVASIMTVGQVVEMVLLPFLPFFLKRLGMKWTLVLGMAAWGIRYGIFSRGHPLELIIFGIALHGICYDFFFVAAYIHVDNAATRDIRASAQALFNLVTMGLGMWLGNMAFGWLKDHVTAEGVTDWSQVWAYPAVGVAVAVAVFVFGFREHRPAPRGAAQ